jgi:hypothetical protein
MELRKLRNPLIAAAVLFFLVGAGFFVWRSQYLKSRAMLVKADMSRGEVEAVLGPPYLTLQRTGERGTFSSWVDNFWQADVVFDPDGQVESVGCMPSQSFYNHTVEWTKSLTK